MFMTLGQCLLGEKVVWGVVGGWFEGKFSVSLGSKPGFKLWIWTCTELDENISCLIKNVFSKQNPYLMGVGTL